MSIIKDHKSPQPEDIKVGDIFEGYGRFNVRQAKYNDVQVTSIHKHEMIFEHRTNGKMPYMTYLIMCLNIKKDGKLGCQQVTFKYVSNHPIYGDTVEIKHSNAPKKSEYPKKTNPHGKRESSMGLVGR
jgi:hypothetical protein